MRKLYKSTLLLLVLIVVSTIEVKAYCYGGSQNGATVTPTSSWQQANIGMYEYVQFNLLAGTTYIFTFCSSGGSGAIAPPYDAEFTLWQPTPVAMEAYNNDYCGTNPQITWTCTANGVYNLTNLQYSCTIGAAGTYKVAYKITTPANDNICTATYLYSNRCALTYAQYNTTSATNSSETAPGCGTYNGGDVWFSTKAPASGKLNIGTQAGGVTNAAVAAYKATSCSSTLTSLGCSYIGPGSMPQLNLTGLTPGDSIFIRFYSKNNIQAGTFGIGLVDPSPYYCMVGNANEINGGSNCINITPDVKSQLGAVWNTTQINMSSAFDYTYYVNLGSSDAGADGLTFTLQNNAAGLSAIGSPGYNLGIGPLTNTFIAEFDTYDNGVANGDGIAYDHIAIDVNGNFASPVAGPIQASSTSANIEDGAYHPVRITWNPSTTVFSIYFDGVLRLTYTNDIITNVFGGNPMVYWGFTGSTGSFTNAQSICPGTLPGAPAGITLPVTLSVFDASIINNQAILTWSTYTEENSKEFIIERSNNAEDFSSIGKVEAHGNSSQVLNYQFNDENLINGISYYRVKQVDINGQFRYSEIKVLENNLSYNTYQLYPNPSTTLSDIFIEVRENATVEIYDMANVLLHTQLVKKGKNRLNVGDGEIKSGVYYALIRTTNEVHYTKIMLAY